MSNSEGELAFILAHEIGHATDDLCQSLGSRARLADQSNWEYFSSYSLAAAQETDLGIREHARAVQMSWEFDR